MSFRTACLLCVAALAVATATPTVAKKHVTHHAKKSAKVVAPALIWRGDVTTARAVADDMESAWRKTDHGAIEVQSFNTASGLDAVRAGSADIAGIARGASGNPDEAGLTFTPVAWDALVMITNPNNPVSNLSLQQVHDIYMGKLTNWSQVGGRDEPINVYAVASPGDGVEFSLRKLMFGRGNQPVAAPRLYVNTAKLQEGVVLDPRSLGASSLATVAGNPKIKVLSIDGVAPNRTTLANGSYALFSPLYVVTSSASPKAAQSQQFVDFLTGDAAKAVMRKHDLIPYADGSVLASMDDSRRTKILAAVGARAVPTSTPATPPLAAPGATLASRAAEAPNSERTLAARDAMNTRNAKSVADKAKLVRPGEAIPAADKPKTAATDTPDKAPIVEPKPSLDGVGGSATTLERSDKDSRFAKVNASAYAPSGAGTAASGKTYTVARGDTLYSIAQANAVDVMQLRQWNHLNDDELKPGQQLKVATR